MKCWEKHEIRLAAARPYRDPYREVEVWVDLAGPGFSRRVRGFWDGGSDFVVRVTATAPGTWRWTSGSNQPDPGLAGRSGEFTAESWTPAELEANPNRRGMVLASPDGRGLVRADGTPFFLLGDTWWALPSFRFPLANPDDPKPVGPGATLNDLAHYRKSQGFNCIALLAAQPAWANDGRSPRLQMEDGTWVRAAWAQPGTDSAKDMHNEGGRPFLFPGKVPGFEDVFPDVDRINPDYFRVLDAKIDYLNGLGFVPFIEVARRDTGQAWQKFYDWPESYARYVQYVFARYQANICIFSPIHYDYYEQTIPGRDYNEPCNLVVDRWGRPPFGTLLSANANPSTLVNFGGPAECRWIDLHQSGNLREHHAYWYLKEMHAASPAKPALNGEPYYAGLNQLGTPYPLRCEPDSETDLAYVRSGAYGSFLSGGLAGFIYGAEGIWQADTEPQSLSRMWDSFLWRSADQVRHLQTFAMVRGVGYRDLVPEADLVMPNKSGPEIGYVGWAYCAATPARDWLMLYFEPEGAERSEIRGVPAGGRYKATWFDPRDGTWHEHAETLTVPRSAVMPLPARPDRRDWGLMLERV